MSGVASLTASLPAFPTTSDMAANLRQAIASLNGLATNFNPGGITQTYIEALCLALGSDASQLAGSNTAGAYELLQQVRSAAYAATATDIFLDLKAADVGITRKGATVSNVSLIFTSPSPAGAGGITIPIGTIVSGQPADPTQAPVLFQTTTLGTIASGQTASNSVSAQSVNSGTATILPANSIKVVVSGASGLLVNNPAASFGGTDREGDDAPNGGLRYRTLQAIPNASQCTIIAIQGAALTYPGITSATVIDLATFNPGTGTVTSPVKGSVVVFCDDGSGNLASNANTPSLTQFNADLTAGLWRSAGVTCIAYGSTLDSVTIALSIDVAQSYLNTGATVGQVQLAVQAAVYGYVQSLPLAAPVVRSSIIQVAAAVDGVSNVLVSTVSINGVTSDLSLNANQVGRCGSLSAVSVTVNATTPYN